MMGTGCAAFAAAVAYLLPPPRVTSKPHACLSRVLNEMLFVVCVECCRSHTLSRIHTLCAIITRAECVPQRNGVGQGMAAALFVVFVWRASKIVGVVEKQYLLVLLGVMAAASLSTIFRLRGLAPAVTKTS